MTALGKRYIAVLETVGGNGDALALHELFGNEPADEFIDKLREQAAEVRR